MDSKLSLFSWVPLGWKSRRTGYIITTLLQLMATLISGLLLHLFPDFSILAAPTLLVILVTSFGWGIIVGIYTTLLGSILLVFLSLSSYFARPAHLLDTIVALFFYLCIGLTMTWLIDYMQKRFIAALLREQALYSEAQTARQQLEAVLDVIPIGITISNNKGSILKRNKAISQGLGDLPAEVTAIEDYQMYKGWWGRNGQALKAADWPMAHALKDGKTFVGEEIKFETFHGEHKTFLVSAAPIRDSSGTINGAVSALFDISERKRLEQSLQEVERQATQRTLELEALQTRTHEALQVLLKMAEIMVQVPLPVTNRPEQEAQKTRQETARHIVQLTCDLLDAPTGSIVDFEHPSKLLRPVAIVSRTPEIEQLFLQQMPQFSLQDYIPASLGEQLLQGEAIIFDTAVPDGEGKPTYGIQQVIGAPMHIGQQLIGFLSFDYVPNKYRFTQEEAMALVKAIARLAAVVIERERLIRERTEAQAAELAAQEANRLKDEFIGIAGHELRTPLTTIRVSVQLARRQVDRLQRQEQETSQQVVEGLKKIEQLLERSERQVNMQNRLVNDLLDVSRIETNRLELHPQLFDLGTVVREVVEDQRYLSHQRSIDVTQVPTQEIPVIADVDRIRQVITNYLTNALKYSESTRPIAVSLHCSASEAFVEVRDEGPGIPPSQQERIWERFYRIPGAEVKSGSGVGLGLGLHISKTIIERMGGHVGVRSSEGKGSTFWFSLPLAED